MDKRVVIVPEVYDRIPGLIVFSGVVDVTGPNKELIEVYLRQSWHKLREEVLETGYKIHPHISQWREALIAARIPVKAYPPSIEAIAKRAMSVTEPFSINPTVDAYNAMSMDLVLPLGAYDLDQLEGNLQLRVAQKGEDFQALGASSLEPTTESEIVYADNANIITRQFLWRQSDKAKITENTRHIIFVCELLNTMDGELREYAEELIKTRFRDLFGVEVQNFVIDQRD